MNRIITILVTIFILLLLYIWISHVWGSDKPSRPQQIVDATESETLGADDTSADADTNLMTDLVTENETPVNEEVTEEAIPEEEKAEPEKIEPPKTEIKQTVAPVAKKTEEKPKTTTKAEPTATKTSQPITKTEATPPTPGGKHLVIVGNFLQRVNADQRMQELKKAGFSNVEVVTFDLSEYHTVCAGRFEDVNEARKLVKKLKDYHKIDAYVRVGS